MMSAVYTDRFFVSILENSTDLISIINAEGCYKFVAGSVNLLLGYLPEELVGTNALDYMHEEDRVLIGAALQNAVNYKQTLLPHFRFRAKDGSFHWIECRVTDMVSNNDIQGYVTNSRIITQQVLEADKKKRSQAHYESLFYNHPDAVFELNKDGLFTRVNKSVSKVLEYPDEAILGSHFRKFVHTDFLTAATTAFLNTLKGNSEYLEIAVVRESGSIGTLGITVFPVLIDTEIVSLQGIAKDITQKKKYENFLKEQSDIVNNIMERISECFYSLDENWRYTYVNNHYANYLQKSKEELIGSLIWEVYPEATKTRFYQECYEVVRTGMPAFFEEKDSQKEDSVLSFQIFPATKGVAVHLVDITEKKKEQDALEKLSLVASKSTTSVMIKDAQRRIEWVNEAFEKATGYTLEDCFMQPFPEMLAGKDTNKRVIRKIIRKMEGGKPFQGEILNYTKAGEKIWFYMQTTPIFDNEGAISKFVSIRTDITERKFREEELLQVAQDLYRQNIDLQQFSYMVSHNLRAPAANLMGLSSILSLVDRNSQMFDETLGCVKESAKILDHVIRDMNHILTIREQNRTLILERVDIKDMLEELFGSFQFAAAGFSYDIKVSGSDRISTNTNKVYLYEILKNLLSNAVKFRKTTENLVVHVCLKQNEKRIELTIKDNGIGLDIEPVKLEVFKLYKKFHKGYEGRGLGLFLVKTYLEAIGGSVKLESKKNIGTTVKIKLRSDAKQSIYN